MYKIVITFFFFSVISGCTKPEETDDSINHRVYYDYYSAAVGSGGVFQDFVSKRICYDVGEDRVVWEKTNQHIMPSNLTYSIDDIPYSTSFIRDNYLIKIFPAKDDPGSPVYYASGIYFEKIDKLTGEVVISRNIINSTEFSTTLRYTMSNVIADGNNFIFGCNNGYLYCYDMSGNLVWRKANFPIRDSNLANGKANLFYNTGKIYFFTVNPTTGSNEQCCLNAQTGETVWRIPGGSYNSIKGVFFDNVNIYTIHSCGVNFNNKLTGQYINSAPYSGCSSFNGRSIGSIDGVTAIIFSKNNEIGVIHTPIPDPMGRISFANNPFGWNYFLESGLIYGGDTYSSPAHPNSFVFARYNYGREAFDWEISFPISPPVNFLHNCLISNYKSFNDHIYLLTNFHVDEQGRAVLNERIRPNLDPSSIYDSAEFPGIIILDKQTGRIIKQIKKMPASINSTLVYNFNIE